MLERYPEVATSYSIEGARHDRLFDNSLDALAEWQKREDEWLAELGGIGEPAVIGSRDWVTYGFLFEELAAAQASRICHKELWETSTTTAWHVARCQHYCVFEGRLLLWESLWGQNRTTESRYALC